MEAKVFKHPPVDLDQLKQKLEFCEKKDRELWDKIRAWLPDTMSPDPKISNLAQRRIIAIGGKQIRYSKMSSVLRQRIEDIQNSNRADKFSNSPLRIVNTN